MPLLAGTRLGPYEILGPLGAGGMGEVYSARDGRLGRSVAIKVLPGHLAADERLRQRFEREARALATLAHPHICTLHDVGEEGGIAFLVMERLEGETLAARLARGPLPPAQVARLGAEMAGALDQAHRRGVVHRDLKPANVMLTREGVKLLDFGLARATVDLLGTPGGGLSQLATESQPLTTDGAIVGTVAYMAPEQLEGREADARTDLFALGAVLYEMATGRRAFAGTSLASLIAAILSAEPARLSTLSPLAPAALERAVGRCLAKDPEARWQSARDLQLELASIAEAGADVAAPAPATRRRQRRERLAWLVAAGVLAAALGVAVLRPASKGAPGRAVRFTVALPEGTSPTFARVSPDGRNLSFTAVAAGGASQLWLRPIDSLAARPLPGTEGAARHFWSPDSRSIAFFAEGKLKRVDVDGGVARIVCDAPGAGPFRLGAWGADGTMVFRIDEAPGHEEGLFRVAAAGGEPKPIHPVDESGRKLRTGWPSFLPDGRHYLAACVPEDMRGPLGSSGGICLVSLETSAARELLHVPSYAEYVPPGYLVYVEGTSLFAHPFDADVLRLHGEPSRIADGLESWIGIGTPTFSLSANGVLVYQEAASARSRLLWKDRSGRLLGEAGVSGAYESVRLAPGGRRAVVTLRDSRLGVSDLWIVDLERNVASKFAAGGPDAGSAVWSPDAARLAYCRPVDGPPSLRIKPLGGGGEEVPLASTGSMQCATDWSADGRFLLFTDRHPSTGADVWLLPLDEDRKAAPLVRTPFREYDPSLSPDGRWLAHVSDESGQPEVYVQPFPGPGERVRVSPAGGTLPRWRRDGRELFYQSADDQLIAVPVEPGGELELGPPSPLFDLGAVGTDVRASFDVAADGQRFLVIAPERGSAPGAIVVLDWTAPLATVDAPR